MEVRRNNPKEKFYSVLLGKSVNYKEYISEHPKFNTLDELQGCENCQENHGRWNDILDMYICDMCDPPQP